HDLLDAGYVGPNSEAAGVLLRGCGCADVDAGAGERTTEHNSVHGCPQESRSDRRRSSPTAGVRSAAPSTGCPSDIGNAGGCGGKAGVGSISRTLCERTAHAAWRWYPSTGQSP